MPSCHLLRTATVSLCLLLLLFAPTAQQSAAAQEPVLAIPSNLVGYRGQLVQVPIEFSSGGHTIAGTAFSIDFDESCLALNIADDDRNGMPDGVHVQTPPAFRATIGFDATDIDGEVDVTIADFAPPFATLPDQTLLTLDFTVICTPPADEIRRASVGFSALPRPSFSDTEGRDITGSSHDGSVDVFGGQVPTPTVVPIATATATAAPTPIPAQTITATVSPTPVTTPAVPSPTATATPTIALTARATGTAIPEAHPFQLYIPLLMR